MILGSDGFSKRIRFSRELGSWQLVLYLMGGTWVLPMSSKNSSCSQDSCPNSVSLVSSICWSFWAMYTTYVRHLRIGPKVANVLWHQSRKASIWYNGWNQTWKLKWSEKVCMRFVSHDLYLSVVNGCDRARPYVAGTTNMTCSFVSTSLRHFKVNHPWRVIT